MFLPLGFRANRTFTVTSIISSTGTTAEYSRRTFSLSTFFYYVMEGICMFVLNGALPTLSDVATAIAYWCNTDHY
jgi:hypothetical protein